MLSNSADDMETDSLLAHSEWKGKVNVSPGETRAIDPRYCQKRAISLNYRVSTKTM